jgi:hypothetical protein
MLCFDIDIEIWYGNQNSDVGIEIPIPKTEFRCWNRYSDYDIETEILIQILTSKP